MGTHKRLVKASLKQLMGRYGHVGRKARRGFCTMRTGRKWPHGGQKFRCREGNTVLGCFEYNKCRGK
jgi:hypothetical protein